MKYLSPYIFGFALCISLLLSPIVSTPSEPADKVGTPTLAQLAEADTRLIMATWEVLMKDFIPSDMMTLDVPSKKTEVVCEDIEALPATIKGAYFVSSSEDADIDFTIIDPGNKLMFKRLAKKEGIFYFDANATGTYYFVFNNRKWLGTKQITFTLSSGKRMNEQLVNVQDLTPMEAKLQEVDQILREIQTETRFAYKRQETHYRTTQSNHRKVFYVAIFESLAILAVTVWQVYYIKRLLGNRRII